MDRFGAFACERIGRPLAFERRPVRDGPETRVNEVRAVVYLDVVVVAYWLLILYVGAPMRN